MSQGVGIPVLRDAVERVRIDTGIDPQIAIVLTDKPIGCDDIFYVPVANDVRGIGYQHQDPREVFDDSPNSRLEGIAFLNDFPYWAANPEEFSKSFNHEVGHRWGVRVHATIDGVPPEALLGRQQLHWSYFFDTEGSPLEGNIWTDLGEQRFRADTPLSGSKFSDLDLYLMGVLPKEDVAPARLLLPTPSTAVDCKGVAVNAASPPQWCGPLDLGAATTEVSIDDVIAAEGERIPAAESTTKTVDVAVVVINTNTARPKVEDCTAISSALEQRFADFEAATGGRISLNNLTASSASCESWESPSSDNHEGGCSLSAPIAGLGSRSGGSLLGVLGWLWWRRTRALVRQKPLDRDSGR